MAEVAFEHVEKRFDDGTRAVVDFSLEVADGELLVLVGPSGCGKSTLLRLLAGLDGATTGTLRIGGRVVDGLSPQERNVAMVFQDYALYPFLSVRGNLEFPLQMRRLPKDEVRRRVDRIAALLDIAPLLGRLPRQLSGGQRQRVAMGRALVRDPSVFLLDEPLSNLDAKLRSQVRAEIGDLQRQTGTTMIYVTHDQVEAMTLGHRVAVVNLGRLQQVGAPQVLYDVPANLFVAGFIGTPPMNLVPAAAVGGAGGIRLRPGSPSGGEAFTLPLPALATAPAGERLTVGIRPESLRLAADGRGDLQATVRYVEQLGHETLAHVTVADARLVARLPGMHSLAEGARIGLTVAERAIHVFDERGNRLGSAG